MTKLSNMTLKQKLGQLFMFGFDGYEVPEHMNELFKQHYVGGIIYFRRNVSDHASITALSAALQKQSAKVNDIPLAIAIDQEGGMVARIDQDITVMPGQMTLGATNNEDFAYDAGIISGAELAQMGITVNFAPVLDVNNNPLNPVIGIRSFGENPNKVAGLGTAMINGYQAMGIAACAKHFPGHGDTTADSHEELPTVAHSLERLHELELVPFKAAIKAGVELIMTAHVQFPAVEPEGKPATLSYRVLTELLRQELGFNGVIVTDCLEMNAISEGIGVAKGAVEAFKAGADLILVSHQLDRQLAALEALEAAVQQGIITEQRVDESVQRILDMKERQQQRLSFAKAAFPTINGAPSWERCYTMLEHAVTLVQDHAKFLPLSPAENTLVIWPEVRRSTQVDEVIEQEETLGNQLRQHGVLVDELIIGTEPLERELKELVSILRQGEYKQIVVGLYQAAQSTGQQRVVSLIQDQQRSKMVKVVYVSLRNPYDYALLNNEDTYVCAYENRPAMMRTVSRALLGSIPFKGKLPVQLKAEKLS